MRRSRLNRLIAAGLVDSFGLALGWTVFVLLAVETQGLVAAGIYNAAMLVGVGLSAPAAGWLAGKLDGKRLLQSTAALEAALRIGAFVLLLRGEPILAVAGLVAVTNVVAWTGYAGMRAEIAAAAETRRARALTWYAGGIAGIEAAGAAAAAILVISEGSSLSGPAFAAVLAVYGGSLLPTFLVAGASRVPRSARSMGRLELHRNAPELAAGFSVMLLASGPTFLSVALAAELHGRVWVAPAAVAFTIGALLAPLVAAVVEPGPRLSVARLIRVDSRLLERGRGFAAVLGIRLPAAVAGVEAVALCNARGWLYDGTELDEGTWYVHAQSRGPTASRHRIRLENATACLQHETGSTRPSGHRTAGAPFARSPAVVWPVLGVGIVAGWALAPWHVLGLLLAQLLAGVFMTTLEGVMDARVAGTASDGSTAGLGWAAATRALGSAAAVAAAPALIGVAGLTALSAGAALVLGASGASALAWALWSARRPSLRVTAKRRGDAPGLQPST